LSGLFRAHPCFQGSDPLARLRKPLTKTGKWLLFLHREVPGIELAPVDVPWAQKPKRLPAVLTREQARAIIASV
jgi:hypothetical protein